MKLKGISPDMLPFGHLSVSYLSGGIFKKASMPALLIGGILPDMDYIFFTFLFFNHIHRLWTHNLLFILLAAFFVGGWVKKQHRFQFISGLLIGGLLHLFIDACMDANPTNGIGVPFFWPFHPAFYSPLNLLELSDSTAGWNDRAEIMRRSLYGLLYEIPLYLLALFVFVRKRKKRIQTAVPVQ